MCYNKGVRGYADTLLQCNPAKGVTDSSLLESGYSFLQDYSANALHEIDAKHL